MGLDFGGSLIFVKMPVDSYAGFGEREGIAIDTPDDKLLSHDPVPVFIPENGSVPVVFKQDVFQGPAVVGILAGYVFKDCHDIHLPAS